MHTANDPMPDLPDPGPQAGHGPVWRMRVLSGTHAGATRRCLERDVLLLGSAEDCDVILTDTGVAMRHGLLTFSDGRAFVRAVDAALNIEGKVLSPGATPRPIEPMQELLVGSVRICLGPEDAAAWAEKTPSTAPETAASVEPAGRNWTVLAGLAIAMVAGLALWHSPGTVAPAADLGAERLAAVEAALALLPAHEVLVGLDDDLSPRLEGYVPDAESAAQLRRQLADLPFPVSDGVRNGERIAGDVAEVMRLSGLGAQARWLGAGEVEVRGAFGDPGQLSRALQSPQMEAIAGLRDVVAVNTLPPAEQAPDPDIEPRFRIVRVQAGDDPFIVTADGGHYYVGAELPTGEQVLSITQQHVVTWSPDQGVRRLDLQPATERTTP